MTIPTTTDYFLGGKLRIIQPSHGHRAGTDTVLLAACCPAAAGEWVLDMGSGVGTAGLCVAARVPSINLLAIEQDANLAQLATTNAAANNIPLTVLSGDGLIMKVSQPVHHVITNPPFHDPNQASPHSTKPAATLQDDATLQAWVAACARWLRPKGTLTVIYRADRLPALLQAVTAVAGDCKILPLWPKAGQPAKRVIIQARKDYAGAVTLLPGIILHHADGAPTPYADSILRGGAALPID